MNFKKNLATFLTVVMVLQAALPSMSIPIQAQEEPPGVTLFGVDAAIESIHVSAGAVTANQELPLAFEVTLNQSYLQSVLDAYAPNGAENAFGADNFKDAEGNELPEEEILLQIATDPYFQEISYVGAIHTEVLQSGYSQTGSMENENRARFEAETTDDGLGYTLSFDNTIYYTQPSVVSFSLNLPLADSLEASQGVLPVLAEDGTELSLTLGSSENDPGNDGDDAPPNPGDVPPTPENPPDSPPDSPPDAPPDNDTTQETTEDSGKATDTDLPPTEEPPAEEENEPVIEGETTLKASLTAPDTVDSNVITYTFVAETADDESLAGAAITDALPLGLYFTGADITLRTASGTATTENLTNLDETTNPSILTNASGASTLTYLVPESGERISDVSMILHTKADVTEYARIILSGEDTVFTNGMEISGANASGEAYRYATRTVSTTMLSVWEGDVPTIQPMSLAGFNIINVAPFALSIASDTVDLLGCSSPQEDENFPAAFETLNLTFGTVATGESGKQVPVALEIALNDDFLLALRDSTIPEQDYPDMSFEFTLKNVKLASGESTFTDPLPAAGALYTEVYGKQLEILDYTFAWAGTPGESDIIVTGTMNRDIYLGYSNITANLEFELGLNDAVPDGQIPDVGASGTEVTVDGWHTPALPGDPDEPFSITKAGPAKVTDSAEITYEIYAAARPGQVLDLSEIWDTLPKELQLDSIAVSLNNQPAVIYETNAGAEHPIDDTTNPKVETVDDSGFDQQRLSYQVPDTAPDTVTSVKLTVQTSFTEEYRISLLSSTTPVKTDISNEANIKREDPDKTYPDVPDLTSDPQDTIIQVTPMGKDGALYGKTGNLYEWSIKGKTFMPGGSDAFIVDFIDDIAIHEYDFSTAYGGVKISPPGADDSGSSIMPEQYDGGLQLLDYYHLNDIQAVEALYNSHSTAPKGAHENHAVYYNISYDVVDKDGNPMLDGNNNPITRTGQVMILKLSDETIRNTFQISYLTQVKTPFDPTESPDDTSTLSNLANLFWRINGNEGNNGDVWDPSIEKGVPIPTNIVVKNGLVYNPTTQVATWGVDINERGQTFSKLYFSDIIAKDFAQLLNIKIGGTTLDTTQPGPYPNLVLASTSGSGHSITLQYTATDPMPTDGSYYRISDYTAVAGDVGMGVSAGKDCLRFDFYVDEQINEADRYYVGFDTKIIDPTALSNTNASSGTRVSNTATFSADFPGKGTVDNKTQDATVNVRGAMITKTIVPDSYSFADNSVKWRTVINPNSVHLSHELSITDIMPEGSDFGEITKITYAPAGIDVDDPGLGMDSAGLTHTDTFSGTVDGNAWDLAVDVADSADVSTRLDTTTPKTSGDYQEKAVKITFTGQSVVASPIITGPIILEYTTRIVEEKYIAEQLPNPETKIKNYVYLEGLICYLDPTNGEWVDVETGGAVQIDPGVTETDPGDIFSDTNKKAKDQSETIIDARPNLKNGYFQKASGNNPETIAWEVFLNRDDTSKLMSEAIISDVFQTGTDKTGATVDYQYLRPATFKVYQLDFAGNPDLAASLDFSSYRKSDGTLNTSSNPPFEDVTDKILDLMDADPVNSYIDETGFQFQMPATGNDPDHLLTSVLLITFQSVVVAPTGTSIADLGNNLSIKYKDPGYTDPVTGLPDDSGKVKNNATAALDPNITIKKSSTRSTFTTKVDGTTDDFIPDFALEGATFTLTAYEYKAGSGALNNDPTRELPDTDFDPTSYGTLGEDWLQKGLVKTRTTDKTGAATFPMLMPNRLYVLEETGLPTGYVSGYSTSDTNVNHKRYIMVIPESPAASYVAKVPDFADTADYALETIAADTTYATTYHVGEDHPNFDKLPTSGNPFGEYKVNHPNESDQKGPYDDIFLIFNAPIKTGGKQYDIVLQKVIEANDKPLNGVLLKLTAPNLRPRYALTKKVNSVDGIATFHDVDVAFDATTKKGDFSYQIEEVQLNELSGADLIAIAAYENDPDILTWNYSALDAEDIRQKGKVQLNYFLDSNGTFKYTLQNHSITNYDHMVYLGNTKTEYTGTGTSYPILTDFYKRGRIELTKVATPTTLHTSDKMSDALFAVYLKNPSSSDYTNKTTAGDLTKPAAFLYATATDAKYHLTDTVPDGLSREDGTKFPKDMTADSYTKKIGTSSTAVDVLFKGASNTFQLLEGTYNIVEVLAPTSAYRDPTSTATDVYYWVEGSDGKYVDSWFPSYLPLNERKTYEVTVSSDLTKGLAKITVDNKGVTNIISGYKKHRLPDGSLVAVQGVTFTLTPISRTRRAPYTATTVATDANGKFSFSKVPEGRYTLTETSVANATIGGKSIALAPATISYTFDVDANDNITVVSPTASTIPDGYPSDLLNNFTAGSFLFINTRLYDRGKASLTKVSNVKDSAGDWVKLTGSGFAVYAGNPADTTTYDSATGFTKQTIKPVAYLSDADADGVYTLSDQVPATSTDYVNIPLITPSTKGYSEGTASTTINSKSVSYLSNENGYWELLVKDSSGNPVSYYAEEIFVPTDHLPTLATGQPSTPTTDPNGIANRIRYAFNITTGATGTIIQEGSTGVVKNAKINGISGLKKHQLADGTVVNVAGVEITLYPADSSWNKDTNSAVKAVTKSDGSFSFGKVAAGKYIMEETDGTGATFGGKSIPMGIAPLSYRFQITDDGTVTLTAPTAVPDGYPSGMLTGFTSSSFLFMDTRLNERGPLSLTKVSNIKSYVRPDGKNPQYGDGYVGLGGSGFAVYAGNPADTTTYDSSTGYTDQAKLKPVAYLTNPTGDGLYTLSATVPSATLTDYADIPIKTPATKGYSEGTATITINSTAVSYLTNEYGYWELLAKDASGNPISYYVEELMAPPEHFLTLSDGRPATPAEDPNGNHPRMRYPATITSPTANTVKENDTPLVKNYLGYEGFKLLKVASQSHYGDTFKLSGAKFGLYLLSSAPTQANQGSWYDESNWVLLQSPEAVSGQNGGINFTGLTQGVYALVELDADGGGDDIFVGTANGRDIPYAVDSNNRTLVKFDGNNAVYVLEKDASGAPVFDSGTPKWTALTDEIVFNNERAYDRGSAEVEKQALEDASKKLTGAEFAVYTKADDLLVAYLLDAKAGAEDGVYELSSTNLAGESVTFHTTAEGIAYLSDEYGKLELLCGDQYEYYVVETVTPPGYAPLSANGMDYGANTVDSSVANRYHYDFKITGNANLWSSIIQNKLAPGVIEGIKTDKSLTPKPLANAVIGLFEDGCTDFTQASAIQTYTTAADGKFRFEYILPGAYVVREISAPVGYVLNPDTISITVTGDAANIVDGIELFNDLAIQNDWKSSTTPGDPGVTPPSGGDKPKDPPKPEDPPTPTDPETPKEPEQEPLPPLPGYPVPPTVPEGETPPEPTNPTDPAGPETGNTPPSEPSTTDPGGKTTVEPKDDPPTNDGGKPTGKVVKVYNQETGEYEYFEEYLLPSGAIKMRPISAAEAEELLDIPGDDIPSGTGGRPAGGSARTPKTFDGSVPNQLLLTLMGLSLIGMGTLLVRLKKRQKGNQ